jgi:hypothetical protein
MGTANQRPHHASAARVREGGDGRTIAKGVAVNVMQKMVAPLLKDAELTPGQLAELRAIDALYYSRLAGGTDASSASMLALDNLVLARVRDMLLGEQRARFDRELAARQANDARDAAHSDSRR